MITEDLIELGFKRIDDYDDDEGFHYYEYNVCDNVDFDLIASSNGDNTWSVTFGYNFETTDKSKVKSLIELLSTFNEV